jgi:proline iminopeptidase
MSWRHGWPARLVAGAAALGGFAAIAAADVPESGHLFHGKNVTLYYEVRGSAAGTPLFMVNGGPGFDHTYVHCSQAWDELARHRRVVFYDQRGNGRSPALRPGQSCTLSDQIEDLDALRGGLGFPRIDLIGHSWGGGISVQLAVDGLVPIRRLVLEDPGLGQTSTSPEQLENRRTAQAGYIGSVGLTRAEAEAKFRPNLALGWTEQDLAGKIDAAVRGSRTAVERVFQDSGDRNQIPLLARLPCPTLLLRAEVARGGIVGEEADQPADQRGHHARGRPQHPPRALRRVHEGGQGLPESARLKASPTSTPAARS